MTNLLTLHDHNSPIPSIIKELYHSSFPPEERREWCDIESRVADPSSPLRLSLITYEGNVCGFITWWQLKGIIYVEHFAVSPSTRGNGIGAAAITEFVELMSHPVVLEVELPGANDMADRRIRFYERCGFTAHRSFSYTQPPYGLGLPPVPLMLMTAGTDSGIDTADAASQLHHTVYGVK